MNRREEVSFGQAVSEGAPVESKDRHGSPNPSYAGCRFRGARVGASVPIGTAGEYPPSLADILPADPPVSADPCCTRDCDADWCICRSCVHAGDCHPPCVASANAGISSCTIHTAPTAFPGYEHDPDAPLEAGNEHGDCRECELYPCGHDPCPCIGEGEL